MFIRILKDSFARQSRRKLLTAATLALATAIATATLSVALDVGDRLAREFRSLGANLLVTPQADTLPLEIGGVDYRPVDDGAYLPEGELGKLKTIFWRNNIEGFAPFLDVPVTVLPAGQAQGQPAGQAAGEKTAGETVTLIGTWYRHDVQIPNDGGTFSTGIAATNPYWGIEGRWFGDGANECVVGTALARRAGIAVGQTIALHAGNQTAQPVVVGIVSSGGQEDDAVLAPLSLAQHLSDRPSQYRRLLVSALTKPEDAFSQRDPRQMTPVEFDRWYCSPYISSISRQMQEQLPGVEVRPIRQVAEGEGRILTRVGALMWLVTGAALLGAALGVAATAGTTVLERTHEIGLMKALGAPRLMVGALFLGEQWLLALFGGTVGYVAGLGLAHLLGERVFGVSPEVRLILFPVVLGMAAAVATLGSVVPLRRVVRLDPATVLRGE
jgi:putative ABC transport system permease protein